MNKNDDASQEHNNTKCHTGYRDTIFFKTYDQEFLVIVGIIITSVFCLCTIIPIKIQPVLAIGGMMTLVQYTYICVHHGISQEEMAKLSSTRNCII